MSEADSRALDAIRHTLAAYTWCGDNGDHDGYVATFAPDGVLDIKDGGTYTGRECISAAFLDAFGASAAQLERRRNAGGRFSHHVSSLRIEVTSPQEARCWAYFAVVGPKGLDHWGRYTDRMVPIGDRWLFASRRVSIDGNSTGALLHGPGAL
ncbi:MAG: hypothetical protein JWP96_750 [Polaromonas sp.]|nr:hypothetical protein [Polaromonas sp.]